MIIIYHNPRCKKSREALQILKEEAKEFSERHYLKDYPTTKELKSMINSLGAKPMDLVRTNEDIWKKKFKGQTLSDDDIIHAIAEHPKLMQRPVVINNGKAVIGRPPEKIREII